MDVTEARQLCERLRTLINRGRGKGLNALREALRIVGTLRRAAAPFPRARLTAIAEQLRPWFIVSDGQEESDTAGLYVRDWLMEDITMVEKTWKPRSAPGLSESDATKRPAETSGPQPHV